jgi:hypothetical protein
MWQILRVSLMPPHQAMSGMMMSAAFFSMTSRKPNLLISRSLTHSGMVVSCF